MAKILFYLLFFLPLLSYSQKNTSIDTLDLFQFIQDLDKLELENKKWYDALVSKGVTSNDQEIIFDDEALKLLKDETYRNEIYKDDYSLYDVGFSLNQLDLKKAFWQMINIYPNKKDTIINYIYAYDKILPVEEILLASFYTYAFFDPNITKLDNGKPDVYRPDIFEEYFRRTKEIIFVIDNLRNSKTK